MPKSIPNAEKSANHIFYEWLEKQPLGTELDVFSVPCETLGITKPLVAASFYFFVNHGVLVPIGKRQAVKRSKGGKEIFFATKVYRFVAKYDGEFRPKPHVASRNRTKTSKRDRSEFYNLPLLESLLPFPEPVKPEPQKKSLRDRVEKKMLVGKISEILLDALLKIEALADE